MTQCHNIPGHSFRACACCPTIMASQNDNDIAQVTAMGFDDAQARQALEVTAGNVEQAVNYLLMGGVAAAPAPAPVPPTIGITTTPSSSSAQQSMVVGPISQYSVDSGRSACTCIALTAATRFLQSPTVTLNSLQSMITEGVQNYQKLCSSSSVEHLSVEEVLAQPQSQVIFPLTSEGGIRQGLLTTNPHHGLGLKSLLEGIRQEQQSSSSSSSKGEWLAIIMTKTPETILLCFSPPSSSSEFWLIDSHPRSQLGTEGAYGKPHSSLDELIMSLGEIFPCTELGPDIPEMMAMMYNSFDLYPLKLKR
jgi:hypothetical protein